jgi:hypothetical protein
MITRDTQGHPIAEEFPSWDIKKRRNEKLLLPFMMQQVSFDQWTTKDKPFPSPPKNNLLHSGY